MEYTYSDLLKALNEDAKTLFTKNLLRTGLSKDHFEEYTANSLQDLLSGAFIWNNTKEGQEFWSNIHKKLGKHKQETAK